MGMTFSPMAVMMKQPGKTGVPYLGGNPPTWGGKPPMFPGGPITESGGPNVPAPSPQQPQQKTLGPESVRATGTGPFDQAYRQDLATYAGGLFGRPGGNLSFNPTSNQPFGGAQVGGGNAPLFGMPNTMLGNALGGNPFSFTPQQPTKGANNTQPGLNQMQAWLNQFMNQGRGLRMGAQ